VNRQEPTTFDTERRFAPHLASATAGFSIGSDSWLAQLVGLGRREPDTRAVTDSANIPGIGEGGNPSAGPVVDRAESENGLIGTRRRSAELVDQANVGTWNASLNYSLARPRDGEENQMVTGMIRLQPTPNWAVNWSTGYSFTRGEFTDHVLSLTRRLHDFDANFDFIRAQNGNFAFQFYVALRANPDLKLDYDQRDLPAVPINR
jgi:hypothetical protein